MLHCCLTVLYLNLFILLNYDHSLTFKGIVIFVRWYQISTWYRLLRKFGYQNLYNKEKKGTGTSLHMSIIRGTGCSSHKFKTSCILTQTSRAFMFHCYEDFLQMFLQFVRLSSSSPSQSSCISPFPLPCCYRIRSLTASLNTYTSKRKRKGKQEGRGGRGHQTDKRHGATERRKKAGKTNKWHRRRMTGKRVHCQD